MIRSIPLEKGKMKKLSFSKKGTEVYCLGQNLPKKHYPKLEMARFKGDANGIGALGGPLKNFEAYRMYKPQSCCSRSLLALNL